MYKKSSLQVEKRCTFEKNLRAEGMMLEKEVSVLDKLTLERHCFKVRRRHRFKVREEAIVNLRWQSSVKLTNNRLKFKCK